MAGKLMIPAKPPLPTASNLLFQSVAGIQNSTSMWESAVGAITAATRQCAGTTGAGAAGPCPAGAPPRPGMSSDPAGIISAAVIVVSGSVTDFKFSQEFGDWAYIAAAQ